MRVCLGRKVAGGPMIFLNRLLDNLSSRHDVRIVGSKDKTDINLLPIFGKMRKDAKNVVRIDGIYYTQSKMSMNAAIIRSSKECDLTVFQSKFSKRFFTKLTGCIPRNPAVIRNGTVNVESDSIEKPYPITCVACADWTRPNKRFDSIVKSFLMAREMDERLGLVLIGSYKKKVKHKKIKMLGAIHHDDVQRHIKASDMMIHISHMESCPNVVVESLYCGVPVVCNNIGGSPEIVRDDGIIVDIDKPVFAPLKDTNVYSKVDCKRVAKAILRLARKPKKVDRPDLSLDVVSDKYMDAFKRLLS